jgi:hypothetical protein
MDSMIESDVVVPSAELARARLAEAIIVNSECWKGRSQRRLSK